MSQIPLFVAIHILGLVVSLAIGPRGRPALSCALAFSLGLVVLVLVALGLLMAGIPYTPWTLAGAAAIPLVASAVAIGRRGVDRRTAAVAAIWTVAFAGLCVPFAAFNLSIMTHDSYTLTMLAQVIGQDGALRGDVIELLDEWGVFQVVCQSIAVFVRIDLLYGLAPVFGLSFIPLFALCLWHGVAGSVPSPRRRTAWVALLTASFFTISMVGFHLFYLHTNMTSAVYLFGFVVFFWLAEVERDPRFLPIAMLCLIALAFQRTETPMVAVLFLALMATQTALPRRAITGWLGLFALTVGLWYEFLAWHVSSESMFLTPARCRIVTGALVLCWLYWLASSAPLLRSINRFVPAAIAVLCALALLGAFAWRTDHMVEAAGNWLFTLRNQPYWAYAWHLIVFMALLGLLLPAPRFRLAFAIGIPVYFGFVLLLALGRSPYQTYVDDSANRMTMHILPLIFYYLGLKVIPPASARS